MEFRIRSIQLPVSADMDLIFDVDGPLRRGRLSNPICVRGISGYIHLPIRDIEDIEVAPLELRIKAVGHQVDIGKDLNREGGIAFMIEVSL